MWHKNNPDTPKPTGRVLICRDGDGPAVAVWDKKWKRWIRYPGGYSFADKHVTHWHEIPPFEEPQE